MNPKHIYLKDRILQYRRYDMPAERVAEFIKSHDVVQVGRYDKLVEYAEVIVKKEVPNTANFLLAQYKIKQNLTGIKTDQELLELYKIMYSKAVNSAKQKIKETISLILESIKVQRIAIKEPKRALVIAEHLFSKKPPLNQGFDHLTEGLQ